MSVYSAEPPGAPSPHSTASKRELSAPPPSVFSKATPPPTAGIQILFSTSQSPASARGKEIWILVMLSRFQGKGAKICPAADRSLRVLSQSQGLSFEADLRPACLLPTYLSDCCLLLSPAQLNCLKPVAQETES